MTTIYYIQSFVDLTASSDCFFCVRAFTGWCFGHTGSL